ncbi:MAG: hypothetical protein JOY68_01370 [Candidatus Dormibacteraeota bacterium]|nr:hypothetical protein [Candidatus Dormibacteraeota bacterium]
MNFTFEGDSSRSPVWCNQGHRGLYYPLSETASSNSVASAILVVSYQGILSTSNFLFVSVAALMTIISHSVLKIWTAWIAITKLRGATLGIFLTFVAGLYVFCLRSDAAVVTTDGFVLKLDGKPFAIKGMNYAPVPTGAEPKYIPYGDYFIPYYANVWKPDIDKIREAGVNVIKLYGGNPDLNAGAPGSAGNWKAFLDYCWNNGTKPVYVIMFSYTVGNDIRDGGTGLSDYIRQYTELVKSTVTHPAVFGYMVGNEIYDGVTGNPQFWTNFGKLIDAANDAGLSQGKKPFLTTATNDNFTPAHNWPAIQLGEQSGKLKNIDAWTINVYRGPVIGVPGNSPFTQYAQLINALGKTKPLILGEWGTPHTTRPAPAFYGSECVLPIKNLDDVPNSDMGTGRPYYASVPVADFLNSQWNTIIDNIGAKSEQVCVGGFVFIWSDEYYKANNPSSQQGGPNGKFKGGAYAGGYSDEAGYGVTSSVPQETYGGSNPPITRTLFKGYDAVKTFFNASSHSGGELY